MSADNLKQILIDRGFKYYSAREIYYNIELKKIFSFEAVMDNSVEWLMKNINSQNINQWEFYLNEELPSNALRFEIIAEIKGDKKID